jgi:SAM-dependent methyltransferase
MGFEPDPLLARHAALLEPGAIPGPVLDLACGDGHNGLFLAARGVPVVLLDRSEEALSRARRRAEREGLEPVFQAVDLEEGPDAPLPRNAYGAVLVFRYLHRPLFPRIRRTLRPTGLLVYETFTEDQPRFGRPRNPDHLLRPGELSGWFRDWEILHAFEGVLNDPPRAVARLVCRKPARHASQAWTHSQKPGHARPGTK